MRILALNWRCLEHPQAGGSEINLFEQAGRWARDGHKVTVVCSHPGKEAAPKQSEVESGLEVHHMGGRFSVYVRAAQYMLRNAHKFDVVLDVANGIPFFSPLFARKPTTLLVHHVHGRQWFVEFPKPLAAIGWWLEQRVVPRLYRGSPVVAVSPTTRDALIRTGLEPANIRVIYNGTNVSPQTETVGSAEQAGSKHRIAYVGRLKRYKRVEKLIQAVARLREEFPDVHLDIVGDGDARLGLEELIARLGLQNSVTLHGFVDDRTKSAVLRRATVFAMPSMHEGWGLSVIEANAHACPAVAFDVPGLSAAIRHGETGLLASDDADFVAGIATLLRDEPKRERFAKAAREWSTRFSWDTCATETLEVLEECRLHAVPASAGSQSSRSAA